MIDRTKARMYLSGAIIKEKSVGSIYSFSQKTLLPDEVSTERVAEDSTQVIIPLAGDVDYRDSTGNILRAMPGQILKANVASGTTVHLSCRDTQEPVHFIDIKLQLQRFINNKASINSFDLVATPNEFIVIDPAVSIGKFDGRQEGVLDVQAGQHVFVYVIQGAFEVQDRLLETGIGLAPWNTEKIGLEALSEDAVIIIVYG